MAPYYCPLTKQEISCPESGSVGGRASSCAQKGGKIVGKIVAAVVREASSFRDKCLQLWKKYSCAEKKQKVRQGNVGKLILCINARNEIRVN